ncbi:hypothetical protein P43SY_008801 [Pythium insidiosum]|uniref:Uncharacterized protein n=1 Tax=Pythium insidiosum TaxID=114742 RepID=A0AAD5ME68_PYTIN|nr:hypothetical protein P43SY_008801 [Pythium insidiosum]
MSLSLNCVGARARVQAESDLEAASREFELAFERLQATESKAAEFELAFERLQATESKAASVEKQITDIKRQRLDEQQRHLDWLLKRKAEIEEELKNIDRTLADKRLMLEEKTAAGPE